MFMGAFGVDVGVFATPFIYAWRERETIIDLFEEVSGDRMMYAYFRPGGLAWDVPRNFKDRVREVLEVQPPGHQGLRQPAHPERDLPRPHAGRRRALRAKRRSSGA
jgi:NADH:ubiquinone oxidoreductase subunit D